MSGWDSFVKWLAVSGLLRLAKQRAKRAAKLRPILSPTPDGYWHFRLIRDLDLPVTNVKVKRRTLASRKNNRHEGKTAKEHVWETPSSAATKSETGQLLCPSFTPRNPGDGSIFGIVVDDIRSPRLIQLPTLIPITRKAFDLAAPFQPSEIFRIAAPCIGGQCKNFGESLCHLGKAVATESEPQTELPTCVIRPSCRWWHENGPDACWGCLRVVTNTQATLEMRDRLGK